MGSHNSYDPTQVSRAIYLQHRTTDPAHLTGKPEEHQGNTELAPECAERGATSLWEAWR